MRIISLLAVFCIVFIMGCGINRPAGVTPGTNQTNGTGVIPEGCAGMADVTQKDNCYLKEVMDGKGGLAVCEKISNARIADRCIRFAAEGNRSLCGEIGGADIKDDCHYYWARRDNSSAECANILSKVTQDECYKLFEVPKQECEGINAGLDRVICLANSTGNYSMCSDYSVEGYNKTVCLAQLDASKASCLEPSEICYFELASRLSNQSVCSGISSEAIRTACMAFVSGTHGVCGSLEFGASRDLCYDKVAYEERDEGICGFIETDDYRNDCYQSLALLKRDVKLCGSKVKDWDKNACYNAYARKYENIEACYMIGGPDTRDACIVDVAKKTGEPSFCAVIANDYNRNYNCFLPIVTSGNYAMTVEKCDRITYIYVQWADQCYLELWKKTGDKSMCQKITTEATRNMCG